MPEHLAQGSSEPPLTPGKLRLYGMRFCPYDHRVHLVLTAKSIPHENVFINLKSKPDWYLKRIPSTKVPGLIVEGEVLYESLIIADFLDERYPQRPLHQRNPLLKAKDRILVESFSKVTSAYYKVLQSQPDYSVEYFNDLIIEVLYFDKELAERNTKFFAGSEPGMVDYMLWPWFERFPAFSIVMGGQFSWPDSKLKQLAPWVEAMKQDPTVKEYSLSPQVYAKYFRSSASGMPDYNMPL